jgi:hypothetical protein
MQAVLLSITVLDMPPMVLELKICMDLSVIHFEYLITEFIILDQGYTLERATDTMLLRIIDYMIYPVMGSIVLIHMAMVAIMALGKSVGMLLTEPVVGRFLVMDTLAPMMSLGIRLMGEAAPILKAFRSNR